MPKEYPLDKVAPTFGFSKLPKAKAVLSVFLSSLKEYEQEGKEMLAWAKRELSKMTWLREDYKELLKERRHTRVCVHASRTRPPCPLHLKMSLLP